MGFSIFWYRITRWMYYTERLKWVDRARRYSTYDAYMNSSNRHAFWLQMSVRDRKILVEYLLGIAWGRFTDAHVLFFVDLMNANAENAMLSK